MTTFKDFRDPIEYVVEQYFQRKKNAASNQAEQQNKGLGNGMPIDEDSLPQLPFEILRNRDGKAYKFIYGDLQALQENPFADVIIWQQEIIHDEKGRYAGMKTTYPDGSRIVERKREKDGICTGFGLE